jgi:hypothetical protein
MRRNTGNATGLSHVPGAGAMTCVTCDNTGWVCENHPDRPWKGFSKRFDACDCGAGAPCDLSIRRMPITRPTRRAGMRVDIDENGPRH